MTRSSIRTSLLALCAAAVCTVASAKLPAPSPEAAAKAAEAAAKAAWAGKVDNYKLCLSQDKVAAHYRKTTPSAKPAADGGVGDGDAAFGQPALQLGGAVVLLMEGQQLAPVAFQARAYKPPLAARVVR